jgi:hypothetical protein
MRVHPTRANLDTIVNVAILITCGVILLTIARLTGSSTPKSAAPPPIPKAGERAEQLPGVDYRQSEKTLVLYLRSTCSFCTSSMPFYRRMKNAITATDSTLLVAVGSEPSSVLQAYLDDHSLVVDKFISYRGLPLPTPTALLISRNGTIEDVWVGLQDEDGERRMLDSIQAGN